MPIEKTITYFVSKGEENTDEILKAKKWTEKLGIKEIVASSTRVENGMKVIEVFNGHNVVVVTHSTDFREPGKQELSNLTKEFSSLPQTMSQKQLGFVSRIIFKIDIPQ
ncbi:MAG: hypothetical protein JSV18_02820 [Candidatus Bathyarchaeota archaeon]|nr:MAG: hypothetical protein JSV18_02820 [Candidatus Bathyarchaeota archaeon]